MVVFVNCLKCTSHMRTLLGGDGCVCKLCVMTVMPSIKLCSILYLSIGVLVATFLGGYHCYFVSFALLPFCPALSRLEKGFFISLLRFV